MSVILKTYSLPLGLGGAIDVELKMAASYHAAEKTQVRDIELPQNISLQCAAVH